MIIFACALFAYLWGGEDFGVEFPEPPQQALQHDGSLSYHLFVSENVDKILHLLVVADYPKEMQNALEEKICLDGFFSGFLSRGEKEILMLEEKEVEGHLSLHFLVERKGRYFRGVVVAFRSHLYLLAVEGLEKKEVEKAYLRFFSSFHLVQH